MANARRKGANGEREFAEYIKNVLSLDFTPKRNLEQVRSGGADILCVKPYCFEVKRREKLDLYMSWTQVVQAAREKEDNPIPIVAFRMNRDKWNFLIPASMLVTEIEFGYLQLTDRVFNCWISNHYNWFIEKNGQ